MPLAISVLGGGAWGSTLAQLFSARGHRLRIWRRADGPAALATSADADLIISAVALAGVDAVSGSLAGSANHPPVISCSKGLHPQLGLTASQLWRRHWPEVSVLVLSGPNLATELRQGLPAASVLAGEDDALLRQLQAELSHDCFRLYRNADPLGTELAGALKNVMAIAAGVCDGLHLGANARASLLTRALAEMGLVLVGLGGRQETLYGLAGLGDLLATATSPLSRNYRFGLGLAAGHDPQQLAQQIEGIVEGVPTCAGLCALAERRGWSLPVAEQVQALVEGRIDPEGALRRLMERRLTQE